MLFGATEQTSTTLQYKDISAEDALSSVNSSISFLNRQRNEESFHLFYESVVFEAKKFTEDPILPRARKVPKRYNDGSSSHTFQNPEDLFRQKYYEVIDLVVAKTLRSTNIKRACAE